MAYRLEILPRDEKDSEKKKKQTVKNPKGCVVLVHGICHGAWCWENFINFFAEHSYQCYAVSLRGHGNSDGREHLKDFGLSDYVEDVKIAVETCREETGMKPFLIGHSMGGAVVQKYIGEYEDTVQGAILFAPATAPKMTLGDVFPKNRNLLFATFIAWDCCGVFSKFGVKREKIVQDAAFFSSKDKRSKITQRVKDASRFGALLQAESKKVTGGAIKIGELRKCYTKNYDVHIPVFVIGSYADLYFPEESLMKTADKYSQNGKTALVVLERLCHDMMLDDDEWKASAIPVLRFMENPVQFADAKENHWPREKL